VPPTDASAHAGTAPVTDTGPGASPGAHESRTDADSEDTLDLPLPDELTSLLAEDTGDRTEQHPGPGAAPPAPSAARPGPGAALSASLSLPGDDLLDHVADWGPLTTPTGVLHLVAVRVERDLPLINRWMNDPAVAAFWELAGPRTTTEDHLTSHLTGDGRSVPCLGLLDGTPMSYWEIYRADLDPLARHYPARPHDTGIHLLIGAVANRGQGLGSTLLRAVADLVLDKRPACTRVVAEPDLRNTPSVAAFLSAGFRFSAEVDLPAKRAVLMVRDRHLRHLL
jgi:RimJ/RimL family protein N-acetyltransferase